MTKKFLEQLTDVLGWERKTWAEYLTAQEVDGGRVTRKVTRKDTEFLGGRWGEVIAEGVKAEARGVKNACRDIIDFMVSINSGNGDLEDLSDLVRRARKTESTTRRWIEKGHAIKPQGVEREHRIFPAWNMLEPLNFLEQFTDVPEWEANRWADFLTADDVDGGKVTQKVNRRGKEFLGGRWGEVIEEGVKAEFRGVENACSDIIDFMVSIHSGAGDLEELSDLVKRARETEKTTRRWIEKGHAKRLPVWNPDESLCIDGCFRGCLRVVCGAKRERVLSDL
eukprot:CAMPEP_0183599780 /NCGR_PEP_ID=MMETSP0371-20130417/179604_1 /TAXON_ID=268820 /ORGANISM="Peridinium aciculiferum, Strain PAER-2" /LENGTH=280 /DNA_ID=CAMNT_0025811851 /DNA_START=81 /DNA_END=924 /DNA_ORIENTATION=-